MVSTWHCIVVCHDILWHADLMFSQITGKLHVGMIYDTQYTSLDWIDFGLEIPRFSPL